MSQAKLDGVPITLQNATQRLGVRGPDGSQGVELLDGNDPNILFPDEDVSDRPQDVATEHPAPSTETASALATSTVADLYLKLAEADAKEAQEIGRYLDGMMTNLARAVNDQLLIKEEAARILLHLAMTACAAKFNAILNGRE